jgi:hypothetical protein
MKRKSVMRLLAVAVAASVAVTSPSLPVSLVTVQAGTEVTAEAPTAITVDSANRKFAIAITKGAAADKYEYSLDGGDSWTSASAGTLEDEGAKLTITLDSGNKTAYAVGTIKARLATDTSSANAVANTNILTAALDGTVTLSGSSSEDVSSSVKTGETITATVSGEQSGATESLQYAFTHGSGQTEEAYSNTKTYVVAEGDVGYPISVKVKAGDQTLYTGTIASAATASVSSAAEKPEEVTAEKPTAIAVNSTERTIAITITNDAKAADYDYSLDGSTWINGANTTTGVSAVNASGTTLTITLDSDGKAYAASSIKARLKDDDTDSNWVTSSAALTAALAGTVTLKVERDDEEVQDGTVKVGDVITAEVTGAQTDATLNYTFTRTKDGGDTTAKAKSASSTYTVTKDDIGYTIKVTVEDETGTLYTDSIAPAAATAEVTAKDAAALYVEDVQEDAPNAEVTNDASYKYTYAPKDTTGLEFQYVEGSTTAAASGSWTDTTSWNAFDPGKTYTFYARRAADADKGVAAGTEVVSWTVDFPKLQHKNLVLNYAIETVNTNDRKVTIDQPSDYSSVSYLYTFDGSEWTSTYEKTFDGAVNNTTDATIGIKYDDTSANGVFADSDPVTEYVADVNASKANAPANTPTFEFKVNSARTAYNLAITYSGSEQADTLEYSTDGTTFKSEEEIENATYEPGTSVTVYVRVKKNGDVLASNSKASSESTANEAPAAPGMPTLTFKLGEDNKYALTITPDSGDSGKTLEYSTDGTNFSTETKSTLEGKKYAPGEAVTVYVRVAGSETTLVSAAAVIAETAPVKAFAPTITITSGSVTITADEGYTIRYTTDGSDPTSTTGTVYDAAFTVTDGTTVKAITCADNIVTSDVVSKTYTVSTGTITPSTDKDKTDTDKTTTEPTITTDEDGTKTIVDADGKVIANDKVTIDGKQYITDENGEVLTSQIAETPSGNKVYVGKDGAIVKNKTVTTEDGKKYYATGSGKIATSKFVTTAKGNKVYATKTGALKVSKTFTVNGKKYYAKASGAIATTGFVKTAAGNTVYATKSGALKVNKAFTVDGKKYVADKNGKIVKGKKITIGNKTYTTNKKGVVIKVTTK